MTVKEPVSYLVWEDGLVTMNSVVKWESFVVPMVWKEAGMLGDIEVNKVIYTITGMHMMLGLAGLAVDFLVKSPKF